MKKSTMQIMRDFVENECLDVIDTNEFVKIGDVKAEIERRQAKFMEERAAKMAADTHKPTCECQVCEYGFPDYDDEMYALEWALENIVDEVMQEMGFNEAVDVPAVYTVGSVHRTPNQINI